MVNVHSDIQYNQTTRPWSRWLDKLRRWTRPFKEGSTQSASVRQKSCQSALCDYFSDAESQRMIEAAIKDLESYLQKTNGGERKKHIYSRYIQRTAELLANTNQAMQVQIRQAVFNGALSSYLEDHSEANEKSKQSKRQSIVAALDKALEQTYEKVYKAQKKRMRQINKQRTRRMSQTVFSATIDAFRNSSTEIQPLAFATDARQQHNEVPFHREVLSDSIKGRHVIHTLYQLFDYGAIDIHDLEVRCHHKSLTLMLPLMLSHSGFKVDAKMFRFIDTVQRSHHDLPYHNGAHIADVLQTCFWWVSNVGSGKSEVLDLLTEDDIFSILVAASIHDLKHPGVGNIFLVQSGHAVARYYNDADVLENYHLTLALRLLKSPEMNIVNAYTDDKQRRRKIRQNIVDCVLATSFGTQFANRLEIQNFIARREMCEDKRLMNELDVCEKDELKKLVMRCIVHASDISHFTKRLDLHKEWSERYYQEYIVEKQIGKSMSLPLGDSIASQKQWPLEQQWFIKNLVIPFYDVFLSLLDFPDCDIIGRTLRANLAYWENPIPVTATQQDSRIKKQSSFLVESANSMLD